MEEINKQRLHVNACMEMIRQGMQVVQQAVSTRGKSPAHERTSTNLREVFRESVNKTFDQLEVFMNLLEEYR